MTKRVHFDLALELSDRAHEYLDSCARIRRISVSRLIGRMVAVIAEDQLVLSIMDDDSRQPSKLPSEHSKSRYVINRRIA